MGGPAGPDSAFLAERELFAQEEILGRERTFRSETENQKAEQIGKKVQPKQAEFYHGPMSFVFALLPSNWSQFSPFQVTPVIFAEDRLSVAIYFRMFFSAAMALCARSILREASLLFVSSTSAMRYFRNAFSYFPSTMAASPSVISTLTMSIP